MRAKIGWRTRPIGLPLVATGVSIRQTSCWSGARSVTPPNNVRHPIPPDVADGVPRSSILCMSCWCSGTSWGAGCALEEPVGGGGELVAAVGGAEPPGAALMLAVGAIAGLDGHAADGVGGHGGELAELAVFEPQDAVGDFFEPVVVGDDDHAAAVVGGELAQQPGDVMAVAGVEVGGGLVSEDDAGVVGQGPGDGDALFLPARELTRSE